MHLPPVRLFGLPCSMTLPRGWWHRLACAALMGLALGSVAAAQVVADPAPGAQEKTIAGDRATPSFQAALALWLADDEDRALPALAELAQNGNLAARMLLGLIDATPHLQGPWLTLLDRDLRVALMRAPGGLSGQNWVAAIADSAPLAALWQQLWQATEELDVARALSAMGEDRAARKAVMAIAARRQAPFDPALGAEAWFPQTLIHLLADWRDDPILRARLHPGDPRLDWPGQTPDPALLDDWLAQAPETAPLRAVCRAQCAGSVAPCLRAAMTGLETQASLLQMGSPATALLSDAEFADSPRGMAALARRMLLGQGARMRAALLARVSAQDACLGNWLGAQAVRYDRPLPPPPRQPD